MTGRPRTDDRHPLRRLVKAWSRGEDVDPLHQAHVLAVARECLRESEAMEFSTFENISAAMVCRLYARSLASQDAISCARALGEVIRSLRALKLISTSDRLRGVSGERPRRKGTGFRPPKDEFRPPATPDPVSPWREAVQPRPAASVEAGIFIPPPPEAGDMVNGKGGDEAADGAESPMEKV